VARNPYLQVTKIRQRKKRGRKKEDSTDEVEEWRAYWREAGPISFAEEILTCPQDVPPHPELGQVPEFVVLSDDQKLFLYDLWKGIVTKFILAAGRGAGKTFIIAIYVTWRIVCFDHFTITVMGGSLEQSEKIKAYVDDWRDDSPEIYHCLHRSTGGGNRTAVIHSRWRGYARFPPCSESAARGPHVTQVIIDEVAVGESRSKGGAKAVRSVRGQLISSPNILQGMTSTAHYILGTFYDTWTKSEQYGYTRYRWSTVRHKSEMWYGSDGKPNWNYIDDVLAADRNADSWIPNVWWVNQDQIRDTCPDSTKDEWIVEVLGGMSRGSGLVFSRDDLKACICTGRKWRDDGSECEECNPYAVSCPMLLKLGLKLNMISERRGGVDFGQVAPNALTITGQRGRIVFVLYSDERTGMGEEEVLEWVTKTLKQYVVWDVFCDPEERAMRNALYNREFVVPHIWAESGGGRAKKQYVSNIKRHVEQHILIIPKCFTYLINSLSGLAYDERGNIRKRDDHAFDSLLYAMIDYDVDESSKFYTEVKDRKIGKVW